MKAIQVPSFLLVTALSKNTSYKDTETNGGDYKQKLTWKSTFGNDSIYLEFRVDVLLDFGVGIVIQSGVATNN